MEYLCDAHNVKWYERAILVMKEKGLNQAELARKIDESPSNVSRYLSATRNQDSIRAASKIAEALEVSLDYLILGIEGDTTKSDPLIWKAKHVLDSGVPTISSALMWNIEAFSHAVELELDIKELKDEVAELKKYIAREVSEAPATSESDQPPLEAPTSGPRRRITVPKTKAI